MSCIMFLNINLIVLAKYIKRSVLFLILSGLKIKEEVLNGNITIAPWNDELLNPNSYNYRLGDKLFILKDDVIDSRNPSSYEEIIIYC